MEKLYEGHKVYLNGKYPAIFLNGKNQHIHRLVWEKNNGEIPKGFVIHHKDENKLNWNIENLELLSRKKHIREHKDIVHKKGVPVKAIKGNNILYFNSILEASVVCGTHTTEIHRCFKGTQHQSNGWVFIRLGK